MVYLNIEPEELSTECDHTGIDNKYRITIWTSKNGRKSTSFSQTPTFIGERDQKFPVTSFETVGIFGRNAFLEIGECVDNSQHTDANLIKIIDEDMMLKNNQLKDLQEELQNEKNLVVLKNDRIQELKDKINDMQAHYGNYEWMEEDDDYIDYDHDSDSDDDDNNDDDNAEPPAKKTKK
jgi:hypothetical protein